MSDGSHPAGEQPVPALFFARVERRYGEAAGDLEILRGADLAIWPGELVALVAPSGAGKSTLLHLAGLLERPDGGEVYVGGRPTAAMRDAERTRLRREEMGFVYQFHHLLPEVPRPAALAGGEQQRVAIARAVAKRPRLILADEPTGNLDPGTAGHVFSVLMSLVRASGLAALVATHNLDLAARMDRRVTIRDGLITPLD